MPETPQMSDERFSVLSHFANVERLWDDEVLHYFPEPHQLLSLCDQGYLIHKKENPNLLYLLPDDRKDAYFYIISSDGLEAYRLEKQIRDINAQASNEKRKRDHQDRFRFFLRLFVDLLIAVLGFLSGAFFEHFFSVFGRIFIA